MTNQFLFISSRNQQLLCYENDVLLKVYPVSLAKNGLGEVNGSECTPRGWHRIYSHIGLDAEINSVFVARKWTGEIFSQELAEKYPNRDWILTRILQLDGFEEGRNHGNQVDSLKRYIYIHGTPDSTIMYNPGSHGCIRMRNFDIIEFADWVKCDTYLCIE